jgi:hypothetical protein
MKTPITSIGELAGKQVTSVRSLHGMDIIITTADGCALWLRSGDDPIRVMNYKDYIETGRIQDLANFELITQEEATQLALEHRRKLARRKRDEERYRTQQQRQLYEELKVKFEREEELIKGKKSQANV